MLRALTCLLLLALVSTPLAADEIYRVVTEDGDVVYTDEPPRKDAEPMDLAPLNTVPALEAPSTDAGRAQRGTKARPTYGISGIHIVYPPQDKAIRHNGGNVPFRVALEPKDAVLPRGHKIAIFLDGEMRAKGRSLELVVSSVARGPHTARAVVLDKAGGIRFASETTKFYLLRVSLGPQNAAENGL